MARMSGSQGEISVREAGRRGGQATASSHGREFYQEIGHKGGQRVRELIEGGKAILNDEEFAISDDFAVVIPAGTNHNIVNESDNQVMKLYTIYSPAQHPDGTIHKTREESMEAEKEEE